MRLAFFVSRYEQFDQEIAIVRDIAFLSLFFGRHEEQILGDIVQRFLFQSSEMFGQALPIVDTRHCCQSKFSHFGKSCEHRFLQRRDAVVVNLKKLQVIMRSFHNYMTSQFIYMLTLESRRFPGLGEASCFIRTLPNHIRNRARGYYNIVKTNINVTDGLDFELRLCFTHIG